MLFGIHSLPSRWRRFLAVFFGTSSALVAIIVVQHVQDREHERAIQMAEGNHAIALQLAVLEKEMQQIRADLLYLSEQRDVIEFLTGERSVRDRLEANYLSFCERKEMYDQIRILDNEGREVIRVNYQKGHASATSLAALQQKTQRYYFQQALTLDRGQVLISPFDLNVEHDQVERPLKPVIRFLTPLYDRNNDRQGFLVLNFLGSRLLDRLALAASASAGCIEFLNSDGEYLQAEDPDDAWGWMLGHDRSFRGRYPEAWERIRGSQKGQFLLGNEVFTFQRVRLAESEITGMNRHEQQPNATDVADVRLADGPQCYLVARVASEILHRRSANTLRQQLLVLLGALCILAAMAWHLAMSAEHRERDALRITASELRLRQLSTQLLTAQEEERKRISRELHDVLGQQATAVQLDLRSACTIIKPSAIDDLLERALSMNDQMLKTLHSIASRIRPTVLDDLGLRDAVESYLDEYTKRTGIQLKTHFMFERTRVPAVVGENVYRILQEALANVAKHARTKFATVTISTSDEKLELIVRDHGLGSGTSAASSGRLGILGMRERAELLDGTFRMDSRAGQGTEIEVVIPLTPSGL